MTEEQLQDILNKAETDYSFEACKIFAGLKIITKYLPAEGIGAAEHDIVYSCDAGDILKAGLTEEDARQLGRLGWFVEEEALAHFA